MSDFSTADSSPMFPVFNRSPTPLDFETPKKRSRKETEKSRATGEMVPIPVAWGQCCKSTLTQENEVYKFKLCEECLVRNDTFDLLSYFRGHVPDRTRTPLEPKFYYASPKQLGFNGGHITLMMDSKSLASMYSDGTLFYFTLSSKAADANIKMRFLK